MRQALSILILFFVSVCHADGCNDFQPQIFFGNGMFNDSRTADASAHAIYELLKASNISARPVLTAYNANENALFELLQVANQKTEEYGRNFYRYFSNLSAAPEGFRSLAASFSKSYDSERYIIDADLRNHVEAYKRSIAAGHSVIVLMHSQGNFYGNTAWNLMNQEPYIGRISLIGAAVPTSNIGGAGPYVSLTQDKVMNFVRFTSRALPANSTNQNATISGHEFVTDYLGGSDSGPRLLSDIKSAIADFNRSSDDSSQTNESYVHSSLIPFWSALHSIEAADRKLSDSECVAIASFKQIYSWWGVSCEERSLASLEGWMDDCFKSMWTEPDRFDFRTCTLSNGINHPECNWQGAEVSQHVTANVVSKAKALLEKPNFGK